MTPGLYVGPVVDRFLEIDAWPTSRKMALLLGAMVAPVTLFNVVMGHFLLSPLGWVDMRWFDGVVGGWFLFALLAGLMAWVVDRRGHEGRWTFYAIAIPHMAFAGTFMYTMGFASTATIITVPVSYLIGMVMFDARMGRFFLILGALVLAAGFTISAGGWLPYAPAIESRSLDLEGTVRFNLAVGIVTLLVAIVPSLVLLVVMAAARRTSARLDEAHRELETANKVIAGTNVELLSDLRRHAEQLTASRKRLVNASDEARRQVERDLHDGAQQHLVTMRLKLARAMRSVPEESDGWNLLADAGADLENALRELRDLAHGIFPQILVSDGLVAALRRAVGSSVLAARLDESLSERPTPEVESAVYFCCVEALQNAAKHAGPNASLTVCLSEEDNEVLFEVSDDGRGFDMRNEALEATGLQNMADRLGALGGTLEVQSTRGSGTAIRGRVPRLAPSMTSSTM
jgi:signal transduction histidine kinase